MGRKPRDVQPWSSAEAAKATLIADWGEAGFQAAAIKAIGGESRFLRGPTDANRKRALIRELAQLQRSAKKVRELVGQLLEFDPDPKNLQTAALIAYPRPLDEHLKSAREVRDAAALVETAAQRLGQERSRLQERLSPAEGFGEAVEIPNARLLAAARALREVTADPPLTGTRAAWLSIALKLEKPATSEKKFQDRRRAWDARLKRKPARQDALDRLRGQPPEAALEQERNRHIEWVRRLIDAGRLDDAMDLLGPDILARVGDALEAQGDERGAWAFRRMSAEAAQRAKARKRKIQKPPDP